MVSRGPTDGRGVRCRRSILFTIPTISPRCIRAWYVLGFGWPSKKWPLTEVWRRKKELAFATLFEKTDHVCYKRYQQVSPAD